MQETQEPWVRSPGREDPLEESMTIHSTTGYIRPKKLDTTEWLTLGSREEESSTFILFGSSFHTIRVLRKEGKEKLVCFSLFPL